MGKGRLFLWAVTSALAGVLFGFDTVVISGAEKQKLTKKDLMDKFAEVAGMQLETDAVLLSK